MSLSQFHCTSRLYLDMHGLIFETSICYWQDQPGRPPFSAPRGGLAEAGAGGCPPPRQAGAEAPAQCLPAGARCGGPLALQPQTPHMTPPCRRGFIVARDKRCRQLFVLVAGGGHCDR